MADGYNHESKNCVAIRLQLEDKEILEKFKKELNYTGPIYEFHRITAANKLNRRYIGIDNEKEYLDLSIRRYQEIKEK